MVSADAFVRAQARALIRVLIFYGFDRGLVGEALWRDVETFGHGAATAGDLNIIGRKHAGAAAAVFCGGVKLRAPNAALYLALASFTRVSPQYRFLDPSRWIALSFAFRDKRAVAEAAIQREVLGRLESALASEIALPAVSVCPQSLSSSDSQFRDNRLRANGRNAG
jgi:hypothetical protein